MEGLNAYAAFCLYPVATRLYSYVRYERRVKRA